MVESRHVSGSIAAEALPFVWTDDDLETENIVAIEDGAVVPQLCIAPSPATGLNEVQLRQIEDFLTDQIENFARSRVSNADARQDGFREEPPDDH